MAGAAGGMEQMSSSAGGGAPCTPPVGCGVGGSTDGSGGADTPVTPQLRPATAPDATPMARTTPRGREGSSHVQPQTPVKKVARIPRTRAVKGTTSRVPSRTPPVALQALPPPSASQLGTSAKVARRAAHAGSSPYGGGSRPTAYADPQCDLLRDGSPAVGEYVPVPRHWQQCSPVPVAGQHGHRQRARGGSTPVRLSSADGTGPAAPLHTRRRLNVGALSQGDDGRSPGGADDTPSCSPSGAVPPPAPVPLASSPIIPSRSLASSSDMLYVHAVSPVQTPGPSQSCYSMAGRYTSDFVERGEVGRGHFGRVAKVQSTLDGVIYAVKVVDAPISGAKDRSERMREARALSRCSCPYIVRYYGCWIEESKLYLQTELCDGGSLSAKLEAEGRQRWDESSLCVFFMQMLLALAHLHDEVRIAHLDVKPDNIYLTRGGVHKLGDFGHAHWLDASPPGTPVPITPVVAGEVRGDTPATLSDSRGSGASLEEGDVRYLPQDMLNGKSFLCEADVFALGITLYEIASGQRLPQGEDWTRLRADPREATRALQSRGARRSFALTAAAMMARDPAARPSAVATLVEAGGKAEGESWIADVVARDARAAQQLTVCSGFFASRALARGESLHVPAP